MLWSKCIYLSFHPTRKGISENMNIDNCGVISNTQSLETKSRVRLSILK